MFNKLNIKSSIWGVLLKKLRWEASFKTLTVINIFSFKPSKLLIFPKIIAGVSLLLYFLGYQPTLGIPPVKKSIVYAQFSQQQSVTAQPVALTFSLPHPGYVSTKYSSWHPGVDIATGLGMPVHPIAPGTVSGVYFELFGLGHHVEVTHDGGYTSTYGHMGSIYVKVGDKVTEASILGQVGLTGRTTGPHTHLELTKNGQTFDPLTVLPKIDNYPGDDYYNARKLVESLGLNKTAPTSQKSTALAKITPTPTPKVDLKAELAFNL